MLREVRSTKEGAWPTGAHLREAQRLEGEEVQRQLGEARGRGQGLGTGKRVLLTIYFGLGAWDPKGAPALEPFCLGSQ